jgi:hypothetical protein
MLPGYGEDLLEQKRDLNEQTHRVLRDSEATSPLISRAFHCAASQQTPPGNRAGDSRTALADVGGAERHAAALRKRFIAMETPKKAERPELQERQT